MRPAIRIIFAPTFKRDPITHGKQLYVHGTADKRTIRLDPRGSMLLETFVHELTHIRHPGWTEKETQEHTVKRMKKMSWKDKARLLKLLGSAIIEGEET